MRVLLAVTLLFGALTPVVWADGCMMVSEAAWKTGRERALINEPEQKAVVYFSKGREDLIISPSYEGPSGSFAWVVPVPARPKVEIVKGAIFHELAALTQPPPSDAFSNRRNKGVMAAAPAPVTVLERKTVGAYDVSVLSATDGQALVKWLMANKYHMPAKAVGPIKSYVKQGWTFVACRIKAPGAAKGLRTGTLAPLKLTFNTKRPVYPMKLSAANPKSFRVLVYLILPSREIPQDTFRVWLVSSSKHPKGSGLAATLKQHQKQYPTLAKLTGEKAQVFMYGAYVTPAECTTDYIWKLPTRVAGR